MLDDNLTHTLLVLLFLTLVGLIYVAFRYYYKGPSFQHLHHSPMAIIYGSITFLIFHNKDILITIIKGDFIEINQKTILIVVGQLFVMIIQSGFALEFKNLFLKAFMIALCQLLFCFMIFWFTDAIGIIKPVWYFLFIMSIMGYIFISWIFSQIEDLYSTHESISNGTKLVDLAQQIQAESNRIFKTVLQTILALGASLGLAMSILYKNGAPDWNSTDNSNSAFGMFYFFRTALFTYHFKSQSTL